jgi:hypothetical protein
MNWQNAVRDLEAEGIIGNVVPSKSVGSIEWSSATALIDLQSRMKKLEADVARLAEVLTAFVAKQGNTK